MRLLRFLIDIFWGQKNLMHQLYPDQSPFGGEINIFPRAFQRPSGNTPFFVSSSLRSNGIRSTRFHNDRLVPHLVQFVILNETQVVVVVFLDVIATLFHGVDFVAICEGSFETLLDSNNDDGENDNKKEAKSAGCRHYCNDLHVGLSFS